MHIENSVNPKAKAKGIPSRAWAQALEGVETMHDAPLAGEDIVRTLGKLKELGRNALATILSWIGVTACDKEKDCTVEITGKARKQAYGIWEDKFPAQAAAAHRQQFQSDLFALYSDITNSIGDGSGNLSEDDFLAAIQTLVTAKMNILSNPKDYCFGLATSQWAPAKKQGFLDYERTGEAGGGAASIKLPFLWEIPVVFSTQVATSASKRQNMLWNREAIAIAMQRNVEPGMTSRLAAAKTGYLMTCVSLYGVMTIAAARATLMLSV